MSLGFRPFFWMVGKAAGANIGFITKAGQKNNRNHKTVLLSESVQGSGKETNRPKEAKSQNNKEDNNQEIKTQYKGLVCVDTMEHTEWLVIECELFAGYECMFKSRDEQSEIRWMWTWHSLCAVKSVLHGTTVHFGKVDFYANCN